MTRVLYAEDDKDVAEVVRLAFSHRPECELSVVRSGRACLNAMREAEWDVLLLDLIMPDLDGLQVLSELMSRRDATPVIMVSGLGQHDLAVRAMRAGAVDCIDKNSPEFLRIADIVVRAHQRYPRRRRSGQSAGEGALHRVLLVDPNVAERDSLAVFLASSVARLQLEARSPEAVDAVARGELACDAVIIGPQVMAEPMLAMLRRLRAFDEALPVIVLSAVNDVGTTIAAFKLGARDYILRGADADAELVFSLNHALRQRETERMNAHLTAELENLNRSLAEQIAARTAELEKEIVVRRQAEQRSEETAARLRALSTRLLRVQEDERRALAQELHDQIGQLLTGLRFQLDGVRQTAPQAGVENALSITDELLRCVRALTLQLRPRLLDDLGLRPALEWHAQVFGQQTGITVDLELTLPEMRLRPQVEIAVFRMVQEALTNVARHSGANAACVTVTADHASLQVEISDRGTGFDLSQAMARNDSLGLAGMMERVRLAGGRLDIFSEKGQGTRLHAEFSLSHPVSSP